MVIKVVSIIIDITLMSNIPVYYSVCITMKVTYCTDLDKSVVVTNCEKRGWVQVGPEDEWNIYWAGTLTCKSLFSVDSGYRMNDNQ